MKHNVRPHQLRIVLKIPVHSTFDDSSVSPQQTTGDVISLLDKKNPVWNTPQGNCFIVAGDGVMIKEASGARFTTNCTNISIQGDLGLLSAFISLHRVPFYFKSRL